MPATPLALFLGWLLAAAPSCRKFADPPGKLTVVIVPRRTHDPLNHESEPASLVAWLNARVRQALQPAPAGFDHEAVLPEIQHRLGAP